MPHPIFRVYRNSTGFHDGMSIPSKPVLQFNKELGFYYVIQSHCKNTKLSPLHGPYGRHIICCLAGSSVLSVPSTLACLMNSPVFAGNAIISLPKDVSAVTNGKRSYVSKFPERNTEKREAAERGESSHVSPGEGGMWSHSPHLRELSVKANGVCCRLQHRPFTGKQIGGQPQSCPREREQREAFYRRGKDLWDPCLGKTEILVRPIDT